MKAMIQIVRDENDEPEAEIGFTVIDAENNELAMNPATMGVHYFPVPAGFKIAIIPSL